MSHKSLKFIAMHFKIQEELALDPLRKVLELSKSNNFIFGIFWTYLEKNGEKLTGNSQIQNKTEFQNLPKNPQYSEADICKSVEFWEKLQI